MITGYKPFQGCSDIQALIQMSTKKHPLVSLPPDAINLVKKMPEMNNFLLSCFSKIAKERLTAT